MLHHKMHSYSFHHAPPEKVLTSVGSFSFCTKQQTPRQTTATRNGAVVARGEGSGGHLALVVGLHAHDDRVGDEDLRGGDGHVDVVVVDAALFFLDRPRLDDVTLPVGEDDTSRVHVGRAATNGIHLS